MEYSIALRKTLQVVCRLKVVFQARKQLSTLFTFKGKINKMLHSYRDYQFTCNICNDIYHRRNKRQFKFRACEYLGMVPLTGKKVKITKESLLSYFPYGS